MGLKCRVDVVFSSARLTGFGSCVPLNIFAHYRLNFDLIYLFLLFHLKDDHPASLITGSQQLSILIELHTGNNVRFSHIIVQCALHLGETPLYVAITCK